METRESKDRPDVATLIAQLPDADMPGAESKLTGLTETTKNGTRTAPHHQVRSPSSKNAA